MSGDRGVRYYMRVLPEEVTLHRLDGWQPVASSTFSAGAVSVLMMRVPAVGDDRPAGDEIGDIAD